MQDDGNGDKSHVAFPRQWPTLGRGGRDGMVDNGNGNKPVAEESAEVITPSDVVEQRMTPSSAHVVPPPQIRNAGTGWA